MHHTILLTKAMTNLLKFIGVIGFLSAYLLQISRASVVSTGDFNKDFFVTWSPSHVNTSEDGKARSLKLDQESGKTQKYRTNKKFSLLYAIFLLFDFLIFYF